MVDTLYIAQNSTSAFGLGNAWYFGSECLSCSLTQCGQGSVTLQHDRRPFNSLATGVIKLTVAYRNG